MKKLFMITFLAFLILTGCGDKVSIIEQGQSDYPVIDTDDYSGEMSYEVIDSYVITDMEANQVATENIDSYMFVKVENSDGEVEWIDYPDFVDENGKLTDGCSMYIVKIRVTNIDAEYKYTKEENYGSPYIFRADNITLNYISEDQKSVIPMTINYYSLRQEGDNTWSTFELEPGETIEYEIGFILGTVVDDNLGKKIFEVDKERLFLCGGGNDEYYQINWEKR
jgi:hypothetical protein